MVGRADLLGLKVVNASLSKSLHKVLINTSIEEKHPGFIRHDEGRLSRRITSEVIKSLNTGKESFIQYPISNEDRSIGARLSGAVEDINCSKFYFCCIQQKKQQCGLISKTCSRDNILTIIERQRQGANSVVDCPK